MRSLSLIVVGIVIGAGLLLAAKKLWAKITAWRSTRVTLHTRVAALEHQLAERLAKEAGAVAAKTV
jgi:outer membrane murein-binding lipoprotein Lpp